MKYSDVLKFCLALPGTTRQPLSERGQSFALAVDSMPFAFFETGAPIQWQFVVRVNDVLATELIDPPHVRAASSGAGRDDGHWLTILRVENFAEEQLKSMISWSYQQALCQQPVVEK